MITTWNYSKPGETHKFFLYGLYIIDIVVKMASTFVTISPVVLANMKLAARGLKPLAYNQVCGGLHSVPVKEQRNIFISQNVPAPTPEQWRIVYAWLKKNGWRTSKFYFYEQACKREGFKTVGTRRAMKKLWQDVFEPKKRNAAPKYEAPSKGVVNPTSTRIQREWKKERRLKSLYMKAKGEVDPSGPDVKDIPIVVRDPQLVLKLRIKILSLRLIRAGKMHVLKKLLAEAVPSGEGEMPLMETNEPGGAQSQVAHDTIIQTHDVPQVAVEYTDDVLPAKLSTNDVPSRIDKLTFRSVVIDTFKWDSTKTKDELVKQYKLPYAVLINNVTAPQYVALWSHAYFRPEYINLEFKVNSSRFSVGQLQVSCYFDAKYDAKATSRDNIYCRSQMLHTLIDAGSSNTVVLKIPYKHFNPWYPLKKKMVDLDIHDVQVRVLAPYSTPDGQAKSCSVTVFATMEDVSMSGLRCASFMDDPKAEGQMLPMALGMAMQYLNQRYSDKNRDKPPLQVNATPLEPRTTGSLACGSNMIEPLNALRLDGRGQVPHPVVNSFDFNIQNLAGNYSLISTFDWSKDEDTGKMLYSLDAGPLAPLEKYSKYELKDGDVTREAYAVPACGVVASCFNVYSGSIKIRFDVVGSFAHTGAFMVAFVPGYCDDADPTFAKAKRSYNVTFDIHEQRSFEFQTPYVADKPWWPVLKLNDDDPNHIACFGKIWVYVLNPLIPMDNIPGSVQVNVYVAAGKDMVFAIPVQSQLALPWFLKAPNHPDDHHIKAKDGYAPYYIGTWRWMQGGNKGAVLRYGPISDHIAQFDNLVSGHKEGWYYYTTDDWNFTCTNNSGTVLHKTDMVLVPCDVGDGYGLIYMAVVYVSDLATFFPKKWTKDGEPKWSAFNWWPKDDATAKYSIGNPVLTRHTYTVSLHSRRPSTTESFVIVPSTTPSGCAQMDNRASLNMIESPTGSLPMTRALTTFGEDFSDLKDLMRRYEVSGVLSVNIAHNRQIYQNDMTFYVMPQGNLLNIENNLVQQIGRDGNRCVLMACARHMLGSINIKFVYTGTEGILWCQHKPDKSISYVDIRRYSRNLSDVTYLHGYASALTSVPINSTLTVNVPYYNPNSLILLQYPDLTQEPSVRRAMSLGEITTGIIAPESDSKNYTASLISYQSIGDDFSPHNYVGWPIMVPQYLYNEYADVRGEGEMPQVNITHSLDDAQLTIVTGYINNLATETVQRIFGKVKEKADTAQHIAFLLLTALPSKSKLSWLSATIGIMVELGIFSKKSQTDLISCVAGFFSSDVPERTQKNIAPRGETEAPAAADDDHWIKFATLAWQGLAVTLDVASSGKPPNLKTFAHRFMNAAKSQAIATRGFIAFFRNIFDVFSDFVTYLIHWWNPTLASLSYMRTNSVIIDKYVEEALDMQNELSRNVPRSQNLANKLDCLCRVGDEILLMAISEPKMFPQPTWAILSKSIDNLQKERLKLLKTGVTAVSRYTPFVVWCYGAPGIGKSEATTSLAATLINALEIKSEDPIFVKPASAAYFTNMTPEKQVIIIDDFESFQHSQKEHSDGAVLMHLKSSAPYNPPMAAVEDKPMLISPKVVLVNANVGWPKLSHITCSDALLRRRDLLYEVRLKKGCQVPKTEPGQTVLDFSHLEYIRHNKFKADSPSAPMTFAEVQKELEILGKAYDANEKRLLNARIKKILEVQEKQVEVPNTVKTTIQNALEAEVRFINRDYDKLVAESGKAWFNKSFAGVRKLFGMVTTKYDKKEPTNSFQDIVTEIASEDEIKSFAEGFKKAKQTLAEATAKNIIDVPPPVDLPADMQNILDLEEGEGEMPVTGIKEHKPVSVTTNILASSVEDGVAAVLAHQDEPGTSANEVININVIEGGTPACPDEAKALLTICWHSAIETRMCEHSDTRILKADYVEGILFSSSTNYKVGVKKCKDYCVSNYSWFLPLLKQKMKLFTFACLVQIENKKGTIMEPVEKPKTYKYYIDKMYKQAFSGLKTGFKWLLKILKVLGMFVIPIVVGLAGIYGAVVGVKAMGRYYSSENRDEDDNRVEGLKSCFYSEWTSLADRVRNEDKDYDEWNNTYLEYMKSETVKNHAIAADKSKGETQNAVYEPKAPPPNRPSTVPNIAKVSGQAQMGQMRDIGHLLKAATVWLQVEGYHHLTEEFQTLEGRGFALFDRYILIPRHYLYEWESINRNAKLIISSPNRPIITVNYNSIKVTYFDHRELCLMFVPSFIPQRNMIKHIAPHARWSQPRNPEVKIVSVDKNFDTVITYSRSKIQPTFNLVSSDKKDLATLSNVIQYASKGKGKCMQILQDSQGFIVGFHIAGNAEAGFAEPVVMESFTFLQGTVKDFEIKENLLTVTAEGECETPKLALSTTVAVAGKVQSKYVRFETGKTKIRESLLHDMWPAKTMPAPLKPCLDNQYTDPLLLGCEKHGEPCYGFDSKVLQQAASRYKEHLLSTVRPEFTPVRKWSENEAIDGCSVAGFNRLVMKTSEGFPYVNERPKNKQGKDWLLNPHQNDDNTWSYKFHPRLKQILEEKTTLRREGIVPQTIFLDCLKDERLLIEKAKTPGKVRIFSVSPLDFLIQYRQNFADFTIAFVKAAQDMHHSIGIAAESLDWTVLARNLQSKGPKILCGDYKNFGPAFSIDVHQKVTDVKLAWYKCYDNTPELMLEREVLCREVENAWHLAGDCLYQLLCGHPSGSPDTTEKNSMVNTIYVYYAWIVIWQEIDPLMAQFHNMMKHVWFTTYGDDLIINVSDEAIQYFNNVNLQKVFKCLGISYTDDSKSTDTIRPWCSLSEATFLKRYFIPHPIRQNVVCGALEKNKLEDIPLWITKTDDEEEATRVVAVQTLLLAHAWGPTYFNDLRHKIIEAWRSKNILTPLHLATWDEVDNIYYGSSLEKTSREKFYGSIGLSGEPFTAPGF